MMRTRIEDRLVGGAGAALVLAALGWVFLGLAVGTSRRPEPRALVLDFAPTPAPRRAPRPTARRSPSSRPRPVSPQNLREQATDIAAVTPSVMPPLEIPVLATAKPDAGLAAESGAADRAGPGEGAGGLGHGSGGDGDGAEYLPPRWIRGRLKISDLPPRIRDEGAGGIVAVRYRVTIHGRAEDCVATVSSGNTELDELTCRLIEQRFRFAPSRDGDGRPVGAIIVQKHVWIIDRSVEPAAKR